MIDGRAASGYNRGMLPSDPNMLLSALNMKLRDGNSTLEDLCADEDASLEEVIEKLSSIGYIYNEERRTFTVV